MDAEERAEEGSRPANRIALLAVALFAGVFLFWNIGARYLWQDEAATAVMAERMLEHGKPLGFGEGNLITMDVFRQEDGSSLPYLAATPERAVATFVERGDFKADTTWIGQPWGQFVFAAISLKAFGSGTVQARLPFVLAAVISVVLLFALVRRRFDDPWMALLAVLLCLGSVYWVLHVRQCRYYATATLFLLVTFASYLRWQDGKRWGASGFVLASWIWFHNDFGSFWPVMIVLGLDSLRAAWGDKERLIRLFLVYGVMAATVLPFAWYYELWTRHKEPIADFDARFFVTLYFLNQYQIPFVFLVAVGVMALAWRRFGSRAEWRVVSLAALIPVGQLVFLTSVGPYPFYRYIVDCTPLAGLVMAFVLVRGTLWLGSWGGRIATAGGGLLMLVTPWLAEPGRRLIPIPEGFDDPLPPVGACCPMTPGQPACPKRVHGPVRGEWRAMALELRNTVPDPNRLAVEFLREHLKPGEEVLINYEDAPLMFYLDAKIRGGIQCYRLEDPDPEPPRFVLIRKRPRICHRNAYDEAFSRLALRSVEFEAPDIPWGNNPDPSGHYSRWADDLGSMGLWECIGWR